MISTAQRKRCNTSGREKSADYSFNEPFNCGPVCQFRMMRNRTRGGLHSLVGLSPRPSLAAHAIYLGQSKGPQREHLSVGVQKITTYHWGPETHIFLTSHIWSRSLLLVVCGRHHMLLSSGPGTGALFWRKSRTGPHPWKISDAKANRRSHNPVQVLASLNQTFPTLMV